MMDYNNSHDAYRSLDMLIADWCILRIIWCPYFIPASKLNLLKIAKYKVVTTASGGVSGKPVYLKTADDSKCLHCSYSEFGKKLLPVHQYIAIMERLPYKLETEDANYLIFKPTN